MGRQGNWKGGFSAFADKPVAWFTSRYLTMLLRKNFWWVCVDFFFYCDVIIISTKVYTHRFRVLFTRLVASNNNQRHSQQSLQAQITWPEFIRFLRCYRFHFFVRSSADGCCCFAWRCLVIAWLLIYNSYFPPYHPQKKDRDEWPNSS